MKSKDEKRADAEARQHIHDELSAVEKLGKLATRGGEANRERARILRDITA